VTVLAAGQLVALEVEKPAVGGPMLARVEGQVVLVEGAIPGERLTARIERVRKGVGYARTMSVEAPSSDRREPFTDPLCGGCLYAHISYARQLAIKAQVIADAFSRIARIALPSTIAVRPSPETGYRMRARLHARGGRAGFFREGSHDVCDARQTRQLLPASCDVIDHLAAGLRSLGIVASWELELSENAAATERVVHLECASPVEAGSLAALARCEGLTGFTVNRRVPSGGASMPGSAAVQVIDGDPHVTDVVSVGDGAMSLKRHVLSFFQGNRFMLGGLVSHVLAQTADAGDILDLYAGVGLFAAAAARTPGVRVVAVEGDRQAARDLSANAGSAGGALEPVCQSVESFVGATSVRPAVVIVDPPRTGMSREALDGVLALGAGRLIYVSCDVATLARDARRVLDAGHVLAQLDAFDLFPNTPHVESVAVFDRT
jgi:23S rRNA (uracil1939-C5)-methyltransferase